MKKTSVRSILPALILAGFTSNVSAAGFAIAEQSVKGLGAAFSGGAASADDASTVWFNPAGMTQFSGTHISQAFHGIFPKAKFNDQGSTTNPAFGGAPLSGSGFDSPKNALVPNFYMTHSLNERMVVGLGLNAPFGLVTDHPKDWVGRYHALRSDVATVNFNPSFAFKVNDKFSVGFGANVQYIDVKLSNAVNMTSTCLGLATAGLVPGGAATCAGLGLADPANISGTATDSEARVEGDDWSWGFNFGVMYEPMPGTRLGAHYRSRIGHNLTGAAEFFHPNPGAAAFANALAGAGVPLLSNQTIKASLDLPESISVSAYHEVNTQWSVQTDFTWTKWSRFKELRIDFASRPDAVTPQQWENSLRYSVGTTYKMNDKVSLRGGLAYEKTPIPSPQLRTPRIADEDRVWVAIGGSYSISDSASLDIGYTHIFVQTPEIDYRTGPHATPEPGALPETILVGQYDAAVDIISVQFNMEF